MATTNQKNNKNSAQPRRGVFIGAYIPAELKEALENEASNQHRTASNLLTLLLSEKLLPKNGGKLGKEQTASVAA